MKGVNGNSSETVIELKEMKEKTQKNYNSAKASNTNKVFSY